MKVRYLGISDPLELLNGKVYDVAAVEGDWYRIVDETHEDYLYPPQCFEVVEPSDASTPVLTYEECAERSRRGDAKEEYRKPREVLAFAGFGTELDTPVGTVTVEVGGEPAEFELLRLFDRFTCAGCTTHFLGVATAHSKKAQEVSCTFHPSGHGSCFAQSGEHVESVGYETEGHVLHISASCEEPGEFPEPADYDVACGASGLTVRIRAKAPAQQIAFGVSWVRADSSEDGTSAWISSDPNFIGECWPEVVEEAASRCPECGSPVSSRSRADAMGVLCPECGWSVVTQPCLPMEDDYTTYTVRLAPGNDASKAALSAVNKILGCGYAKAKQAILSAPRVLFEGDARETLGVVESLSDCGLAFEVEPEFPHHRVKGEHCESVWSDYADGATIGEAGSEGGRIVCDVEYIGGARVTVEETDPIPYSITCGIYGLFVHTAFAGTRDEALGKAAMIQDELADCLQRPPSDETAWCEQFTSKW